MNKAYELTIVLAGAATAAKKKDAISRVEKLLKANEGTITNSEDWGTKELAYTINKNDSGTYLYFDVELPAASVPEVNDKLRLENDIIRYLLVKHETHGKKS